MQTFSAVTGRVHVTLVSRQPQGYNHSSPACVLCSELQTMLGTFPLTRVFLEIGRKAILGEYPKFHSLW